MKTSNESSSLLSTPVAGSRANAVGNEPERGYDLVCTGCGATYTDDGARLQCSHDHGPALLRTRYTERAFSVSCENSILRYQSWLPSARRVATTARTALYQSTALGPHLGLRRLWIAYSGWWPERGATLPTGTFKDLEAVSVLRRIGPADTRTIVVSSAGNTALAFARVCTENDIPALIIVPLRGWHDVMSAVDLGPSVHVVAIADAGYEEAIAFARELCASEQFILEGGVRNVGRRDGMGTAMLAAVEAIGSLPKFYFQAVGSAAGALAAHEAALRLRADGRFGMQLPRLMLSQNAPFTPIHDAWQARSATLLARTQEEAHRQISRLGAFVLSNLAPPYAMPGGIHDALTASDGQTYAITTERMNDAMSLFAELEGAALEPAAGVAVASLIDAVRDHHVAPDDVIVLHITGGGRNRLSKRGGDAVTPSLIIRRDELETTGVDRTRSLVT